MASFYSYHVMNMITSKKFAEQKRRATCGKLTISFAAMENFTFSFKPTFSRVIILEEQKKTILLSLEAPWGRLTPD